MFNMFYLNMFTYYLILIIMEFIEYFLKKTPQFLQVYYYSLLSNFFLIHKSKIQSLKTYHFSLPAM